MEAEVLRAEKGTVVWGVNRIRSDALVALLDDLVELEVDGLDEDRCRIVQGALSKFTNAATVIPDSSWWKRQIWQELQAFEDIYFNWNDVNGSEPHHVKERKRRLKALRKKRNKIATKIRRNQFIIQNELDLQLVRNSYEALGDLARALPDLFGNLAKAVGRFQAGVS